MAPRQASSAIGSHAPHSMSRLEKNAAADQLDGDGVRVRRRLTDPGLARLTTPGSGHLQHRGHPLDRCAELLGVDLSLVCKATSNVEPYVRADGIRVGSRMQLERTLRHEAYGSSPARRLSHPCAAASADRPRDGQPRRALDTLTPWRLWPPQGPGPTRASSRALWSCSLRPSAADIDLTTAPMAAAPATA